MNTAYTLSYAVTSNPDVGGYRFYVKAGGLFDVSDYAEAYSLNRIAIDADSIKAVQDATGHMSEGEWLEITHEATEVDA